MSVLLLILDRNGNKYLVTWQFQRLCRTTAQALINSILAVTAHRRQLAHATTPKIAN